MEESGEVEGRRVDSNEGRFDAVDGDCVRLARGKLDAQSLRRPLQHTEGAIVGGLERGTHGIMA